MLGGPITSVAVEKWSIGKMLCLGTLMVIALPASYIFSSYAPEVYAEQVTRNATWKSWTGLLRDDGMALDSLNQFFTLDIVFHYTMYNKEEIDRSFYYDIALRGRDSSDDEWTVMTSNRRFRRLFCKIGRTDCFGIAALHQIYLPYSFYRVDFSIPHQDIDFISSADYTFRHVRTHFTFYELCLRYTFVFLTLWRLLSFYHAHNKILGSCVCLGDSAMMHEQQVVWLLFAGLFLVNDPFFIFTVTSPSWMAHIVSAIFNVTFVAFLLLFILVMADVTALPLSIRPEFSLRYLGLRLIVIAGLWTAVVIGYTHTRARQGTDASYDVADNDLGMYEILTFVVYICGLVAFFWLVYLLLRRTGQLQEEEGPVVLRMRRSGRSAVPPAPAARGRQQASLFKDRPVRGSSAMRGGRGISVLGDDEDDFGDLGTGLGATTFGFGPGVDGDVARAKRFYFFVGITLVYLLCMLLAWIVAVVSAPENLPIGHLHRNTGELTASLAMTNIFVYVVAAAYSPDSEYSPPMQEDDGFGAGADIGRSYRGGGAGIGAGQGKSYYSAYATSSGPSMFE